MDKLARIYCPVCWRNDISIKKDGTLRAHGSKQGWPPSNCTGSGELPVPADFQPPQPSLTRPALPVIQQIQFAGQLYDANPNCDHYVYVAWSGVKCARCPGWYCT